MEDGKTCPTLRAEAHRNEPIIIEQRKMKRQQSEGIDFYNQSVTGQVSRTLMAAVNPYQIPGLLDTRGKSYGIETSPGRDFSCMVETSTTLRVSTYKNGVLPVRNEPKIYENHSQDARYRDMKDCAPTCNAQMETGGNNVPLLAREEYKEELPFDCALCGHRGETREVDIAEQLREEHPTWTMGWLDELGPIRLTLWGCPKCAEWHTPRAWNDIQVRRTIETKLLAVLDGDKINKKERRGGSGLGISEEPVAYTEHLTVRRLLPVETERLMGFPDNWTRIPWRGKPAEKCPDAPRYKACGNSFCVNCVEWIGERIEKVERTLQEERR